MTFIYGKIKARPEGSQQSKGEWGMSVADCGMKKRLAQYGVVPGEANGIYYGL
jgi:hypothetical protein